MSIDLKARERTVLGKKVKRLRAEGLIPAEVFGHGFENRHISIAAKDFEKAYKQAGENTIITLAIGGKESVPTLISNVERHHITGAFLSIDFHRIRKDEKIRTHVPIVYVGTEAAAKAGYLLVKVAEHVEIEALPDAIPPSFTVDISELVEPGQNKEVGDIVAPAGVKILTPRETVLATVTEKEEEVVTPPPAGTAESAEAAGEKAESEAAESKEEKKEGEKKEKE